MAILYRLNQFWLSVTAGPLEEWKLAEIAAVLNQGEMNLFQKMSASDRQHAYRVYLLLRDSRQADDDLLAAALLHDVGKIHGNLSVWDRTAAVLGETFAPLKVAEWGDTSGDGWKRTFLVRKQHATWGAQLAEEAGARPTVVDLIRRHQDSPAADAGQSDERLVLLQWADGQR